jgi:hypothetical protein
VQDEGLRSIAIKNRDKMAVTADQDLACLGQACLENEDKALTEGLRRMEIPNMTVMDIHIPKSFDHQLCYSNS